MADEEEPDYHDALRESSFTFGHVNFNSTTTEEASVQTDMYRYDYIMTVIGGDAIKLYLSMNLFDTNYSITGKPVFHLLCVIYSLHLLRVWISY